MYYLFLILTLLISLLKDYNNIFISCIYLSDVAFRNVDGVDLLNTETILISQNLSCVRNYV